MVNNNLITKENYKKVEEIRELESQIPTYEEFVKNYQSDQEVNSSYENEIEIYNDISSPKTYGPMYRASAESSREAFIPLKIRCLENNCNNTTAINWVHSSCGGNFQISNRAYLKCSNCSLVEDLKIFSFKCSNHSGNYFHSTSQIDINAFKRALFSSLSEGKMNEEITMELIQYLNNNSR